MATYQNALSSHSELISAFFQRTGFSELISFVNCWMALAQKTVTPDYAVTNSQVRYKTLVNVSHNHIE